jgi:hypothetical protein
LIVSPTAGGATALSNLRIAYATTALNYAAGTGHVLSHAQLVHNILAVQANTNTCSLRNVLIHDSTNAFYGVASPTAIQGEHLTIRHVNVLNYAGTAVLSLTNSLLCDIGNTNGFSGQSVA